MDINRTKEVSETNKMSETGYKYIKPAKELTQKELLDGVKGEFTSETDKRSVYSDTPRYIITRNESLENDKHPLTGVEFKRRVIDLPNGEKIEGVFPNFESQFDAKIPERMYLSSDKEQFKECNKQLLSEIGKNPSLKDKFSKEQLEQIHDGIYDGTAPDGYVWHHDAEAGKIQLVDFETHALTGHTGGRYIWGGGAEYR